MTEPEDPMINSWRAMLKLEQDALAEIANGTAGRPYAASEIQRIKDQAANLQALIDKYEAARDEDA
ncbi:MAG: hypothetical protein GC145_14275 [Caulobacter sp.]|nr:hypothetical protein [Caulobacter sp.]